MGKNVVSQARLTGRENLAIVEKITPENPA
jgi:hypothetical protein